MTLVAGVDSSTQSCKVMIRDAETGALVRTGRAAHPDGTEVDPRHWWDALQAARPVRTSAPVSASRIMTLQDWVDESTPATSVIAAPWLWPRPRRRVPSGAGR